ncbi:hypothetical protein [Paenibacillus xylanilyticus]|uniref:Uncharacterized protein n=1 Tax=Paenibacillus xylanilyticus TaxID=248903 RepID=A0A7Y6EVR9_9BACL|nr:hypothetical protein [Paenibacillus xylanilyticus]NUU75730.1 hypothetical protein [Paenibacillus xylanilyticus]
MITVQDEIWEQKFNDYSQYFIGEQYGVAASIRFEEDLNRCLVLGQYLFNNDYISKEKMIDDIVIKALLKGTMFEKCNSIDDLLNMNCDRQETQLAIAIPPSHANSETEKPDTDTITLKLRVVSQQDSYYLQQALNVENKYMTNQQYRFYHVSVDDSLDIKNITGFGWFYLVRENNTIMIVTLENRQQNEYESRLEFLISLSRSRIQKETSEHVIQVWTDIDFEYCLNIKAEHVSSTEWHLITQKSILEQFAPIDPVDVEIALYDKTERITLPVCDAGEFISSTDKIRGNTLTSDADTWGTAMNAKAYRSHVYFIEDIQRYGVIVESYYVY